MAEQNGRTEMQEMDALRNTWSWSKRWSSKREKSVMSAGLGKQSQEVKGKEPSAAHLIQE